MMNQIRSNSGLTNDQIAKVAPAIFSGAKLTSLSDRYSQIRTVDILQALANQGFRPVYAAQGGTLARSDVSRHVIRLRHPDFKALDVGDVFPEVSITNSHDGTSTYEIMAGIFRQICSNGAVTPIGAAGGYKVRHTGRDLTAGVVDASFSVAKDLPLIGASIAEMRGAQMDDAQKVEFAERASLIRWDSEGAPVGPKALLLARRYEDRESDLWTVFNRVQENMIRGGVRGFNALGRRKTVRAIGSVQEDIRVNRELWTLARNFLPTMQRVDAPQVVGA